MVALIYLLGIVPSVLAQYDYGSPSATSAATSAAASSTSSASSSTPTITVGKSGLQFSPDNVVVAPGHSVVFQFYPGNHSVTQSSFDKPCQPLSGSSIFSGFVNSASGPASQVFTVPVNSTDPIWFYCGQVTHCQSGMVGVINPPSSGQTLAQYKSAAAGSGTSSTPANVQGGTLAAPSSSSSSSPAPSSTKSAGQRALELSGSFLCAFLAFVFVLSLY